MSLLIEALRKRFSKGVSVDKPLSRPTAVDPESQLINHLSAEVGTVVVPKDGRTITELDQEIVKAAEYQQETLRLLRLGLYGSVGEDDQKSKP